MYIAVCDDQIEDLEWISKLLCRWQENRKAALRFRTFRSAAELLDVAGREGSFDLYLLDVMMPGTNGLSAAREIRNFDDAAKIVFLTASPGFAYESYRVHALDYLLKPIRAQMLFPLLDQLYQWEQGTRDGLTVKCGSTLIRIPFSRLVSGKHLYFNLTDGSVREVFGSLNEYEPQLPNTEFMRIGRSCIVNILQIREFSPAGIHTFSGKNIAVPRRLYSGLQKEYMKLLFAQRKE